MTSKEKVLSVYPDAYCGWTSRGWRVISAAEGSPIILGQTKSGHVPEAEAWDDAASKLPSAPSPAEEKVGKLDGCINCGHGVLHHGKRGCSGYILSRNDVCGCMNFVPEPVSTEGARTRFEAWASRRWAQMIWLESEQRYYERRIQDAWEAWAAALDYQPAAPIAPAAPETESVISTVGQYIGLTEDQIRRLSGCLDVLQLKLVAAKPSAEGDGWGTLDVERAEQWMIANGYKDWRWSVSRRWLAELLHDYSLSLLPAPSSGQGEKR